MLITKECHNKKVCYNKRMPAYFCYNRNAGHTYTAAK